MAKGKAKARTARASCQRCTQLRLFCDVPGSCAECRKKGCNCSPAGNEVPGGRNTAMSIDPRNESGARVESRRSSHQSQPIAPPPTGQLPRGWQCFHDSKADRDYYVSPTGHIQWSHPLQGPLPPPLPQTFTNQARGFPLGRSGVGNMQNGTSYPTQDYKRKRGEEDAGDLPAPLRTRAYGHGGSTISRPAAQGFRIPPRMHTNATAGVPPSAPRNMRQPLSRGEFLGGSRYTAAPARGRPGGLQRESRAVTSLPSYRSGEGILPSQAAHNGAGGSQEILEQIQANAHDEAVKTEEEGAADEQELVKSEEPVRGEEPRDFGLRSRSKD
ncbi:hypothetical protein CKM354_000448800 [Cercospora kikuchii]|uniref:WW domain-containing protein n=1 Tax=Cercospora kikuchii TaxID=84275 RepID=A0A9P3CMJ3_9PEZI|nr:uncharacterized protein CKM354_000448800 [Cercospora kikuchii]GIZ41173.1 hypothetical protein CKM354_000448800 [Cercospora kikuchii]